MSEYRIIRNQKGFIPQQRTWWGWRPLETGGFLFAEVVVTRSTEEARAAIDTYNSQLEQSTDYYTGRVVEYYQPQ